MNAPSHMMIWFVAESEAFSCVGENEDIVHVCIMSCWQNYE